MAHMGASTVTSKGQVTLPVALRDKFAIQAGDLVEFFEGYDGTLKMRIRARSAASIVGTLSHLRADPRYATDAEAIVEEVSARDARTRRGKGRTA
ncbi:hypothetical protein GCM10007301_35090 [Azorhizobium oxalatiphilum]|uniref:SpoVT-AbrB domain-containing protein n=1 Tax=Azorhizobium oxalatiphilum TaxID=980631 RepID=A0A917C4V5_9HYPH|nr:AbrB/MazE/SpoVT family DNA-binding domain-containing protein [Azorhizobium oxalatiphilum]GGF72281.1 hypothetical protein GCM10007301_35090 [Azorhizobium oxalatiphilum]